MAGILIGLIALGGGVALTVPILQGKTAYPTYALQISEHEVALAREAQAGQWANEPLADAEATLTHGQLETRLQQVKLYPFRNYTVARTLLGEAERKARSAREQAGQTRDSAKAAADTAIQRATQEVATSVEVSQAMHINPYDRSLISRARTDLNEATLHYQDGAYLEAADAANQATDKALRVGDRASALVARYSDASLVHKWRTWIDDTIAWSRRNGGAAVIINKEKHLVTLYVGGKDTRTWRGELGYNSIRDKTYGGDSATPEGRYKITSKKGLGNSRYHKALLLDYPNQEDRAEFARMKKAGELPNRVGLGGLIEIHGEGGRGRDWTNGCVALSNGDIDELWKRVEVGTPVTIVGGDGSGGVYTDLMKGKKLSRSGKPESDPTP